MRFEEPKKSHKGMIILGIFVVAIICVTSCDFAPKKSTVQTTIQHSVD